MPDKKTSRAPQGVEVPSQAVGEPSGFDSRHCHQFFLTLYLYLTLEGIMNERKLTLPAGENAVTAYDRAMRFGAFLLAAYIARDHDLGRELAAQAAFRAWCRFDDLGLDDMADSVLRQFGLNLVVTTPLNILPGNDTIN